MPAPPLCSPPPQGMGGVGERAPWVTGIPWPAHAFSHGDFFGGRFPKGQSTAIDQHTSDSIPTQDKLVPKLKKKKKKALAPHKLPAGQLRVQPEASTPSATGLSRVYRSTTRAAEGWVWGAAAEQTPVTSKWFSQRQRGARAAPPTPRPPAGAQLVQSGQSRPPAPPPAVLHGGLHP